MLVQITNKCDNCCKHCLQDSDNDDNAFMEHGLFQNVIILHKMCDAKTMVISGGEPTLHPNWVEMVDTVCKNIDLVILATNGNWLLWNHWDEKYDPAKLPIHKKVFDVIVDLLRKHNNLLVQVTNVSDIYPHHNDISIAIKWMKETYPDLKDRILYAEEIEAMVSLGRAAFDEWCLEQARYSTGSTTSCFASALVSAQTDFKNTIRILESMTKFCHPLIDCWGWLHWSESCLCPNFASIPSHLLLDEAQFLQISEAAHAWRPCGNCADYQKLLKNNYPKYVIAKHILGIPQGD